MRARQILVVLGAVLMIGNTLTNSVLAADPRSNNVKTQAEKMYKAFFANELKTFAKYTYPNLLRLMGGADKMIATLEKGFAEMKDLGMSFSDFVLGEPSQMVQAGNELHCTIPTVLTMKTPKGNMISDSFLVGISADNGRTWTFIDGNKLDASNIKIALPKYNPKLVLPKVVGPRMQ